MCVGSVLGKCLRAWMHVFRISSPLQLFKHCAAIAIELPIGLCSTEVEPGMGALVGLLCLTSFLLRAERDGMHRWRDQVSFFSCSDGSKNVYRILY